jgi:hypothetical protein
MPLVQLEKNFPGVQYFGSCNRSGHTPQTPEKASGDRMATALTGGN